MMHPKPSRRFPSCASPSCASPSCRGGAYPSLSARPHHTRPAFSPSFLTVSCELSAVSSPCDHPPRTTQIKNAKPVLPLPLTFNFELSTSSFLHGSRVTDHDSIKQRSTAQPSNSSASFLTVSCELSAVSSPSDHSRRTTQIENAKPVLPLPLTFNFELSTSSFLHGSRATGHDATKRSSTAPRSNSSASFLTVSCELSAVSSPTGHGSRVTVHDATKRSSTAP
jgi:hypothetical protein